MNLFKTIIITIVVTILSFPLNAKKVEAGWCAEIVDGEGVVVDYISLKLDNSDNPHMSYQDYTSDVLKYAYRIGSNWKIGVADSSGNVGKDNSLALDSSGHPRISYYDATNGDLKYAWCESDCGVQDNWQKVTVDDIGSVGLFTSLVLDSSGHPHISYFDNTNDGLKYAWCESGCGDHVNWQKVTIVSGSVSYAATAIAIDSNSKIHIIYLDAENHALKYAWCESGCGNQLNWQIEMVNEDYVRTCPYSLALDNNNNPQISYGSGNNKDLKYVYKFEGNWTIPQMVNCGNDPLVYSSLALDNNNNPYISFCDSTNWDLRFAFIDVDSDNDGIAEAQDNCPNIPNGPCLSVCYTWEEMVPCTTDTDCDDTGGFCSMNQKDTYPPGGNSIGDACECEGNFDCDTDCDGGDAAVFKVHFGRSPFLDPCNEEPLCKGNFDCDLDVDGTDASLFKNDFGRSPFKNPCPSCAPGEWCTYP